ncbi:hypothetical protein ACTXT7_013715, partial [Hymenolepis weldensis]
SSYKYLKLFSFLHIPKKKVDVYTLHQHEHNVLQTTVFTAIEHIHWHFFVMAATRNAAILDEPAGSYLIRPTCACRA